MAFDTNGFFQRLFNWANDRDANIKILAERMDDEFNNYKAGIDAIIGGEQAFRGAIKAPNGLEDAPSFTFSGDTDTGIFRLPGEDGIGFAIDGVHKASLKDTGLEVFDKMRSVREVPELRLETSQTTGATAQVTIQGAQANTAAIIAKTTFEDNRTGAPVTAAEWQVSGSGDVNLSTGQLKVGGTAVLKQGDPINASGDIQTSGQLIGGLKTASTAGQLDWDDDTNSRVGMGATLLRGTTAANAPDTSGNYYSPLNFGYAGTNQRTQLAIPYIAGGFNFRTKHPNTGAWSPWKTIWDSSNFNKSAVDNHMASTANPHSVTKAQVGLGNVTNTSDANKPVSTAQQTALNGKLDKAGGVITGTLFMGYNTGVGSLGLFNGGTGLNRTGYLYFFDPNNAGAGYIGAGTAGANQPIPVISLDGRYYNFNVLPRVNGVPMAMQKQYESAATAWVANSISTFAHGLAEMPKVVEAVLVMKQNVHGYSIGQEVRLSSDGQYGSTIYSDTANIRFRSTNGNGVYTTRASGSGEYITPAQANLKIRAFA